MSLAAVEQAVAAQMARIKQDDLVRVICEFQVSPRLEMRAWDYGNLEQQYPCWIVLEHPPSDTVVCHCVHGFGPEMPWGLLMRSPEASMGMDCQWFATLECAVRESCMWTGENPEGYEIE